MECDCLVGHQLANRKQWSKYPSYNSYCDNYFCYQIIGAKKCIYTTLFSEALGSDDELPPTGRQSIIGTNSDILSRPQCVYAAHWTVHV